MKHEFIIRDNGVLTTYDNFEDIPEVFDNIIKFLPAIPPAPHTKEQHEEIEGWEPKLKELLNRERNVDNTNA